MAKELEAVDKLLQLHQEINILYVVDGYQAIFYKNEKFEILAESDILPTVREAFDNLLVKLERLK
jgi:hypothetical protein